MIEREKPAGAGPATSRSDKADGANVGQVEVLRNRISGDSAKEEATAIARAAILGIEAYSVGPAVWKLQHAHGADIGIVRGRHALVAAVVGFEAAHRDVAALVKRMSGGHRC